MVEDVFTLFAAHGGDDDGTGVTHGEEGTGVRDVGFAAEEGDEGVFIADAEVRENGEGAACAELVVNLNEGGFVVAIENFDVAILAVHPGVDFGVALAGGDGEEWQAVLSHGPGGHVPIARMWDHDDDAVAFIDEGLEAVLIHLAVEDIAVHPFAIEAWSANHFDGGLEDVGERGARDGGTLRGRFLWEDALDAREGAGALEAEDIEEEASEAACEAHGNGIRNSVDERTEEAKCAIFEVDGCL